MLSVARLLCFCLFLGSSSGACARDLYILVIGEGAAANCNAVRSGPVPGVYQIGLDGQEKSARDPLEWSGCTGGSIWIPLGQGLIRQGLAEKVVFMPVAVPGAQIRDWSENGRDFPLLARAMTMANARHITFDYALFQQGYSDIDTQPVLYRDGLRKLLRTISFTVKVKRWLVAQGTGCRRDAVGPILSIHKEVARAHQINRFEGPLYQDIDSAYLDGDCNFTGPGQVRMAQMWLEAIKKSNSVDDKFQKESLLYYFK